MKSCFFLIMGSFLLASCAHHRDVRPGADGVHKVVIATDDKEQGSRDAISQTNHFCEESGRHAAFVNENQTCNLSQRGL